MHKDYEQKAPKGVEVRPFLYFHSLPFRFNPAFDTTHSFTCADTDVMIL